MQLKCSVPFGSKNNVYLSVIVIALVMLAMPRAVHGQDPNLTLYVAKDLGIFDDAVGMKGYGLNNYGQVVGTAPVEVGDIEDKPLPFHWQNGELVNLIHLPNFPDIYTLERGEAYDVSDADQIVGGGWIKLKVDWREDPILVFQAFIIRPGVISDFGTTYPGDAVTVLGAFGDSLELHSGSTAISNNNHVVGWAHVGRGAGGALADFQFASNFHAFLVRPSTEGWYNRGSVFLADQPNSNPVSMNTLMTDLGVLQGNDQISSATGVNDSGQVVGYSYGQNVGYAGFIIDPTNSNHVGQWANLDTGFINEYMIDLGNLGGSNSWARSINNSGVIVGDADTSDFDTHAFRIVPTTDGAGDMVWHVDANNDGVNDMMEDLGTLGGANSAAMEVNDEGTIVGWAEDALRIKRAVIWEDGEITDLNDRLILTTRWSMVEARRINSSGQITGWGYLDSDGSSNANYRAFILNVATDEDLAQLAPTDPNAVVTDANNDDSDGTPSNTANIGTLTLNAIDLDGTQGTVQADPNDSVQPTVVTPIGPCGFSSAMYLPLMMAGLFGMKRVRRV
jgi:probable HAF family extracellular repeat protein